MEFKEHPSEETLEHYLFGTLLDQEVEQVEEHLLVCHSCIESAEQILSFVQSLRSTFEPKPSAKTRVAGGDPVLGL
jgi:anti-sigma factor ChrR (cupin superfamily)